MQLTRISPGACLLGVVLFAFAGSAHAASITHQVLVQGIRVCDDGGGNCARTGFFEAEADKIWAQAGIDMNFADTILDLNETDFLDISFRGANEHVDLFRAGNTIAGDPYDTWVINLYFVDTIDMSASFYGLGCGAPIFSAACGGEAGVIIAGPVYDFNGGVGRLDTVAHEIGHVLGLTHRGFGAGGADNLMTSGSRRSVPGSIDDITPDGLALSKLTQAQIDEVFDSDFVKPIPEPSSVAVFGLGMLLVSSSLRRWPRRER